MKPWQKRIASIMIAALTACTLPFGVYAEETGEFNGQILLTQYDGTEVALDRMPESICADSYAVALILHDLGIPVTSVISTSRPLPEDLAALPGVGTPQSPDFEVIKNCETDLLFASATFMDRTQDFLAEQGIASCYVDITLYSDTRKNIEMLGTAFGKTAEMEALLSDIDAREQAVLDRIGPQDGKTIAIIHGTGKSFLFSTENSYVGQMAEMLGLENIVQGVEASVAFSDEQLVLLDPDIIVRYAHGSNWEEVNESFESMFSENGAYANLKAVQNGNVYDLDAELFTANAGTRSIEAFEALADTLFGQD